MAIRLANHNAREFGLTLPEAYAKIDTIFMDTAKGKVRVMVIIYADAAARALDGNERRVAGIDKQIVEMTLAEAGIDLDAVKTAAYNRLKLEPKFAKGVDV